MKKIAANDNEINLFANRVFLQNVNPGIEKIARRFVELIARAAKVNIGNMQEFHKIIIANLRENTEFSATNEHEKARKFV